MNHMNYKNNDFITTMRSNQTKYSSSLLAFIIGSISMVHAEEITWQYHHTLPELNTTKHPDQHIHVRKLHSDEKKLLINITQQQMYFVDKHDRLIKTYPISSGLRGTGECHKSYKTPRGWLEVCEKYGQNKEISQHYKARIPCAKKTGITSRILTLNGVQSHNKNSLKRCIYIHGTPATQSLGKAAKSEGCIRMHPEDIKELCNQVDSGTLVYIYDASNPLPWQQTTS